MVQQQSDEIDAFIRSLREKAMERAKRASRVESSVKSVAQRVAEQHRLMERLAPGAAPSGAVREPREAVSVRPVARTQVEPVTPAPLGFAAPTAEAIPDSPKEELISFDWRPDGGEVAPAFAEETDEPAPEALHSQERDGMTSPSPLIHFEQAFSPVILVPVADYLAAPEDDEAVPDTSEAAQEATRAEPAAARKEAARRLPDLSALGVSWGAPERSETAAESAAEPAQEPARESAVEPEPVETVEPMTPAASNAEGFLRSQASKHFFEPAAPQPLAPFGEEEEEEAAPAPTIRPIAPLPLNPLPLNPLHVAKASAGRVGSPVAPAPEAEPNRPQTPAQPEIVRLPFLNEEADPQIQMIATAVQAAAKEHQSRTAKPLPKFATMSAYDQSGGEDTVESADAVKPSRFKITMTRPQKRSFWPFGGKRAA